jgi:hypothetical protein
MKKFAVLALAALLVVAFTVPASALENIFGGYWHARFYTQKNFDGDDLGTSDLTQAETRTRLYYTAKLNDNLKLVNKFEMDTAWGNTNAAYSGTSTYSSNWGDAGADGVAIEIKQSYADFNVGPVNFLVGVQNFTLARGFISNDDASGVKAIWKVTEGLYLPFIWQKNVEGGTGKNTVGSNLDGYKNDRDIDMYIFTPSVYFSKDIKINPYLVLLHSKDAYQLPGAYLTAFDNLNAYIFGFDFDAKMGPASIWFTGIMQKGSGTVSAAIPAALAAGINAMPYSAAKNKGNIIAGDEIDLEGYLVAAGGKFDLGKADVHGQVFYATGEDASGLSDHELNGYFTTSSNLYVWAEIMGGGIFDNSAAGSSSVGLMNSSGATGYIVSNTLAANIGATVKPMDKLTITGDLWYAKLAEENVWGEDYLGTEVDLKVTYNLVEGLTLDVVGAYLFAGDATEAARGAATSDGKNQTNPYEFGTQLSLSF